MVKARKNMGARQTAVARVSAPQLALSQDEFLPDILSAYEAAIRNIYSRELAKMSLEAAVGLQKPDAEGCLGFSFDSSIRTR